MQSQTAVSLVTSPTEFLLSLPKGRFPALLAEFRMKNNCTATQTFDHSACKPSGLTAKAVTAMLIERPFGESPEDTLKFLRTEKLKPAEPAHMLSYGLAFHLVDQPTKYVVGLGLTKRSVLTLNGANGILWRTFLDMQPHTMTPNQFHGGADISYLVYR